MPGSGWRGGFRRRAAKPPEDPASEEAARGKAIRLLTRRDYPARQLRGRLGDAGFEAGAADAAVADLEDLNIVNDARYVESAVAGRTARGQGPIRIALELIRAGCTRELVDAAVDRDAAHWTDSAVDLRRRRFGPALPARGKEHARQARFLLQRGFTGGQVRAALAAAGEDEDWELPDAGDGPLDDALED